MLQRCILVILLILMRPAFATLTIEIQQGIDKPFPVVVLPFKGQSSVVSHDLPHGFTQVVRDDLRHSGRFAVLSLPHDLDNPTGLTGNEKATAWALSKQSDFMVGGQFTQHQNAIDLQVQLTNIYTGKPVFAKSFKHIPLDKMRGLAHHVADLIYQAITGIPGDFSTRIAYVSVVNQHDKDAFYRLFVSDADGFNPRLLLEQRGNPIASPAWSPDGKKVAYVSYIRNRMAIYTIDLTTGKRQLLANYRGINSAPAWSPDGKVLAMALSMGPSEQTNLYLMHLGSRRMDQLTNFATNTGPAWSPDGKKLLFTSNRAGRPQIYEYTLATKSIKRLTHQGVQNFDAHYLPNSQSLIVMHQSVPAGPIRLARFDRETGKIQEITHGEIDKSPSISPGGNMVIYANYDHRNGVLAMTSVNGKVQLKLPSVQGSVQSPAWSPKSS